PHRACWGPECQFRGEVLPVGLARRQSASNLRPDVRAVPGHDQGTAALDKPEHVHVTAFIFRATENVLERDSACGRDEQPLAAGNDYRGGVAIGQSQAITE